MPGFPVVACETSYSRGTDQPSHQDACVNLSAEEKLAAEESLSIYCKPIELYNMLRRRAIRNPLFLQRCLDYRIKAKHKNRIQMTVSLLWSDEETQAVFPLSICLARQDPNNEDAEYSTAYRISRIFTFRDSSGIDGNTQIQANFMLPEVNKLAVEARSGSLAILFFTTVENPNSSSGVNTSLVPLDLTSCESRTVEHCLCGKVSLESLYMAWDSSPNFSLGQRAEIMSTVDLLPCIMERDFQNKSISILDSCSSENESISKQVQITISAKKFGAKEKSPYLTHPSSDMASPPLSRIIRLKEGNVMFNYRYYNNKLQRTEVTEDFSCPFCLVRCASYKGLRYHLFSSHDLFNFEFSASEDSQTVNVSVKADIWRYEIVADGIDPKLQTFIFCAKPLKRRHQRTVSYKDAMDADPLVLESEIPAGDTELLEKDDGVSNAIIVANPDPDCDPPIPEHDHGTPAVLQVAKTGKLLIEHSDPRNIGLLKKRQFYHSHIAQPMTLEEVLSDQDSEDEVDEEVVNIEEQREITLPPMNTQYPEVDLLSVGEPAQSASEYPLIRIFDNIADLGKEVKQFIHMWNSFVRKQRVRADGHIPWACEAFSKLHGLELVQTPKLAWCWRLFMIKLYNQNLLDPRTINACGIILEQYKKQNSDPKS